MGLREPRLAIILGAASLAVVLLNAVVLPVLWRLVTFCIGLVAMFLCGREWGGTGAPEPATADPRVQALDELGIDAVYPGGPPQTQRVGGRLGEADSIRMLAVTGERALANLRAILVERLTRGCHITVLLATAGSDLAREAAKIQTLAGIPVDPDGIDKNIGLAESKLLACLAEAANSLSPSESHRLGRISLGHFNTQYRESMILCDRDWVWWTPPFDPARSDERPCFLAQGESGRFRQLCDRHFRAVKGMCDVKELQLPAGPQDTSPTPSAPSEDEPWTAIRQKRTPVEQGWAQPAVGVYAKGGSSQPELDTSCTDWLLGVLEDKGTKIHNDHELVAWLKDSKRGVCVLAFAALAGDQPMGPAAQDALSAFVERGGGLVATHDAISSADHETLRKILGAKKPPGPSRSVERVHRCDEAVATTRFSPARPLLDDIPHEFPIVDQFLPIPPEGFYGARLLSIREGPGMGYAAGWAQLYVGQGRTVYLALGHEAQTYEKRVIRRFLGNAILWAGRLGGDD